MDLESLRWKVWPVLDDGHVILVDWMGSDEAIEEAARVSMGKGTRPVSDRRTLIRYLMRHRHTTPFEMCEVKVRIRIPMDHWRQYIRHRTASVNEYSTRYSEAIDSQARTDPDRWRLQSQINKQGSSGTVEDWPSGHDHSSLGTSPGGYLSAREEGLHREAREVYEERLAFGVAREQARKDLPLSTYTEAFWKIDLHNLLHFLSLRMDSHAQEEIRAYANIIGHEIVANLFPLAWEAFVDYRLEAMTLSRLEVEAMRACIKPDTGAIPDRAAVVDSTFTNKRERDEFIAKAARLGIE